MTDLDMNTFSKLPLRQKEILKDWAAKYVNLRHCAGFTLNGNIAVTFHMAKINATRTGRDRWDEEVHNTDPCPWPFEAPS